jgi:hypothetical protein
MAKAKTKKNPVIDDDDYLPPEPLPPEPVAVARRADTGMVLDLDGHNGEVASALIVNGLRAYLTVVNKGVNVVAANRAHTAFVPVKVEACRDGLDVKRDEVKPLVDGHGVLAFLLDGDGRGPRGERVAARHRRARQVAGEVRGARGRQAGVRTVAGLTPRFGLYPLKSGR